MKFPSINQLILNTLNAFIRFPLAILVSFVGVYFAFQSIDIDYTSKTQYTYIYDALMTCALGLPLFISLSLFTERRGANFITKTITQFIAAGLLFLYYLSIHTHYNIDDITRFFVLNVGLHLLVAFVPFISKKETNGFWQFNKTLFLRYLLSGIYSAVLYIGLAVALLAVDKLLGFHVDGKNYLRLWIVIVGIFNTWFFLSGIPENFEELNESDAYPKGLKIFTQFVLLPLTTVYLTILYLYIIKIFIKMSLPHGWTSMLVICFSTVGILSLLLIYPIKEKEENKWMNIYSRWFYLALFPLIALMFVSIFKRIHDYGITEDRYYVLLLACWLTFIAIYFSISKIKNIKVIPVSLAIVAFISCYGPWSATNISVHSQLAKLETILNKDNLLKDGKLQKTTKSLSSDDTRQIDSYVNYLVNTHGIKSVQPLFKENLDSLLTGNEARTYYSRYYDYWKVNDLLQRRYLTELSETQDALVAPAVQEPATKVETYNSVEGDYRTSYNVKGYDYIFKLDETAYTLNELNNTQKIALESGKNVYMRTNFDKTKGILNFIDDDGNKCSFNINEFIKSIKEIGQSGNRKYESSYHSIPNARMLIKQESPKLNMAIQINSLAVNVSDSTSELSEIKGMVFIRFK
jgi:hypothetical protein